MTPSTRKIWKQALESRGVWIRAIKLGATVGVIQMALNQGDYWLKGAVTTAVVIKTIMTPIVTFGVSLYAATETRVEQMKNEKSGK